MDKQISPSKAFALLNAENTDYVLIDVRSAAEFSSIHAQPAVHVPLEELTSSESLNRLRNKKILCICQSGMRGRKAVEALVGKGVAEVVNVDGGTNAWAAENLPVVRGSARVSIERQVRIAAGALVLAGTLAGLTVSHYLFAIPLFVGAGLLFSGITDTCGMAIALARCPWNSK